ncbi:MAG: hypothetical protein H6873_01200 [Hyphomicrobiaceae bacterium]|nr:hypothetical protein [Hyphomicrobiaceae bacterium]
MNGHTKSEQVADRKSKRRRVSVLYHSAKISDYRFRKLLWHFVRDHSTTEAARDVRLSVNSAHAIYRKLRVFFYEVGLFLDFYAGQDPETFESDNPVFEKALLEYHFERIGRHRGLRSPATEPPYHFAESCWRYDFYVMMQERPADTVYAMMQRHLLELIRLCGPVGARPRNLPAGARAVMRQAGERIAWLKRNAPGFRDEDIRAGLSEALSITED